MTRYRIVEPVHVEEDAIALASSVALGTDIERVLLDHRSPFAMMMERAREAFISSFLQLIDADLTTPEGVSLARSQQADVQRYRDMCRWIDESLNDRAEASETIAGADDEDAMPDDIKELYYGERAKPAPPDA